jgi:hypothetical protein
MTGRLFFMDCGRRICCAALAVTAVAVAPSRAQDVKTASKPPSVSEYLIEHGYSPTLLRQAGDYSEDHPVVVIAISKGQKETLLTGEQIGEKLAEVLKKVHDTPAKYFIAPGGDYTAIAFFVKGHAYGPYGLKDSLSGVTLAADAYDERVRPKTATPGAPR